MLGDAQVLVSIQSLIFVSEPYFNEPGFEGQLGTQQVQHAHERKPGQKSTNLPDSLLYPLPCAPFFRYRAQLSLRHAVEFLCLVMPVTGVSANILR